MHNQPNFIATLKATFPHRAVEIDRCYSQFKAKIRQSLQQLGSEYADIDIFELEKVENGAKGACTGERKDEVTAKANTKLNPEGKCFDC